ncbi:MAG: hypothetical protein Q8909_05440 [Bacteroidota bacterium]|nr:hypothetical protein [Bacteroidota bacterium]
MHRHYWTAISHEERIQAISDITRIVDRYAIVLNFQRFSDIAMSLLLEVEECRLKELQDDLNAILSWDTGETQFIESKADCIVFLNVTFAKGTGDLQIENPNIPE